MRHCFTAAPAQFVRRWSPEGAQRIAGCRWVCAASVSLWAPALLAFLLAASCTYAQDYPTKTIRLIVPLAPGGGNDTAARVVGHKKGTDKIWYFDEVTEVTPLKELPEKLQPAKP